MKGESFIVLGNFAVVRSVRHLKKMQVVSQVSSFHVC